MQCSFPSKLSARRVRSASNFSWCSLFILPVELLGNIPTLTSHLQWHTHLFCHPSANHLLQVSSYVRSAAAASRIPLSARRPCHSNRSNPVKRCCRENVIITREAQDLLPVTMGLSNQRLSFQSLSQSCSRKLRHGHVEENAVWTLAFACGCSHFF